VKGQRWRIEDFGVLRFLSKSGMSNDKMSKLKIRVLTQIGRSFASLAVVYVVRFIKDKKLQTFGLRFPRYKLCINLDKKWAGLHFG
jgi:hypothetical protein